MKPILVDTSVWIDFFRNKNTSVCHLLNEYLQNDHPVFLNPTIVQEILQGIRSDSDYKKTKDILLSFEILSLNDIDAAIGAAELFRQIRKKGGTIRKSNDCLIAYYAIYFKIHLLHNDKDFKIISKYTDLKLM